MITGVYSGGMLEQNQETVEIQGVDGAALKQLVEYCYSGEIYYILYIIYIIFFIYNNLGF